MTNEFDITSKLKLISAHSDAPNTSDLVRQSIKLNLDIYSDVFRNNYEQTNSADVTRIALNYLNLSLSDEILNKISCDDFVEIYSNDCVQLFRTLNVTKLMSYSLETILSGSFEDLFDREEKYTSLIVQAAGSILNCKTKYIEDFCPEHIVSERYGKKNSVVMGYKFMCALNNPFTNEVAGILVVEIIKPLT
ncbi:MAG: hypothetical protein WA160_06860 [Pseudobdellovibrio sp.]